MNAVSVVTEEAEVEKGDCPSPINIVDVVDAKDDLLTIDVLFKLSIEECTKENVDNKWGVTVFEDDLSVVSEEAEVEREECPFPITVVGVVHSEDDVPTIDVFFKRSIEVWKNLETEDDHFPTKVVGVVHSEDDLLIIDVLFKLSLEGCKATNVDNI